MKKALGLAKNTSECLSIARIAHDTKYTAIVSQAFDKSRELAKNDFDKENIEEAAKRIIMDVHHTPAAAQE